MELREHELGHALLGRDEFAGSARPVSQTLEKGFCHGMADTDDKDTLP
jgi:hypothetical protein